MEDLSQLSSKPTKTLIYNNNNISSSSLSSSSPPYPNPNPNPNPPEPESESVALIKSKIISHPRYSALLAAYLDCHRVGAPADVASRISALAHGPFQIDHHPPSAADPDPELDHFMKLYCEMLLKYQTELTRPLKEAMDFFTRVESQLDSLINDNPAGEKSGVYSSDENQEETEISEIDSVQADNELKHRLLKKYGGCLSSLQQQLSKKKKKKGKLPKDARQKLLSWWNSHYKWPYPSESEKVALAGATGLDQKQINNWFINQRKRHWKPSQDHMQFVIEGYHPQTSEF